MPARKRHAGLGLPHSVHIELAMRDAARAQVLAHQATVKLEAGQCVGAKDYAADALRLYIQAEVHASVTGKDMTPFRQRAKAAQQILEAAVECQVRKGGR